MFKTRNSFKPRSYAKPWGAHRTIQRSPFKRNTSSRKFSFGKGYPSNRNAYANRNNSNRNRSAWRGERIDISKFINKASTQIQKPKEIVTHTFADFGFCPELLTNLKVKKYQIPTPIQDQSIKYTMQNRDLIGLANTGTGKTGAFLLPLINKAYLDKSQKVLIIAPTRELAMQIETEFRQFSWSMKIFSASCVGGMPIYRQIRNLRTNPRFVIGTPGRLKDLRKRNDIRFSEYQSVVLDEVDRMLDMGFINDIKEILNEMPRDKQSLFFCATLPPKIRELVQQFLKNPYTCEVKTGQTTENVDQDIVRVKSKEAKFSQLEEILSGQNVKKTIIFSETKRDVEKLSIGLIAKGFKATSIHGNKNQSQRQRALTAFRKNFVNILVATDVAARGLDIKDVTHVINYTVPQTYDDYVHRIGRAGRYDQKGTALTFIG